MLGSNRNRFCARQAAKRAVLMDTAETQLLDETQLPEPIQSLDLEQSPIGKMQDLSMVSSEHPDTETTDDMFEEDSEEECKTSDEEIEIVRLHSHSIIDIDDDETDAKVPQSSAQEASQQAVATPEPVDVAPPVEEADDMKAKIAEQVEEIMDSEDDQSKNTGSKGAFKVGGLQFCSTHSDAWAPSTVLMIYIY